MELTRFTQCHFFAGIGVWSYALRRAGWGDERPVWTGSCPCQPFSAAGKGTGFDDERHLWPAFFHLIEQCRPDTVFGEQVASKDGLAWLDLVQSDMEGAGYAIGAVDTCAAGFGAPHIRQRLYWVADTEGERCNRGADTAGQGRGHCAQDGSDAGLMGDAFGAGLERHGGEHRQQSPDGFAGPLADTPDARHDEAWEHERRSSLVSSRPAEHGGVVRSASPVNGRWQDADWLSCRDDRWRPVQSGTFPLVDGASARLGRVCSDSAPSNTEPTAEGRTMRLRGYGNAICAPAATEFIAAYLECLT